MKHRRALNLSCPADGMMLFICPVIAGIGLVGALINFAIMTIRDLSPLKYVLACLAFPALVIGVFVLG